VSSGKGISSAFLLLQNYPNPFNPTTVITYQLPTNSFVTLKVYDVLGREVKTLVDGYQRAGSHSVTFSAESSAGAALASGVYFYRMVAGSRTFLKKMMFLK
jgi:flagellar hook assembly protein FlgD